MTFCMSFWLEKVNAEKSTKILVCFAGELHMIPICTNVAKFSG